MRDDKTTKTGDAKVRDLAIPDLAQWRIERDALLRELDAYVALLQEQALALREPMGRA